MRSLKLASFASLFLALSLGACTVGSDDGGGGGGGGNGQPDAGGGGGGGPADAAPPTATPCPPSVATFKTEVFDVALSTCANACHGASVPAFKLSTSDQAANLEAASAEAKKKNGAGLSLLLAKPTNPPPTHSGGLQFDATTDKYKALEKFVNQVNGTGGVCPSL